MSTLGLVQGFEITRLGLHNDLPLIWVDAPPCSITPYRSPYAGRFRLTYGVPPRVDANATLTLHVSAYGFESLEAEFWMASARMAYAIRE